MRWSSPCALHVGLQVFLFLLVAMTFIGAMEELRVFAALRAALLERQFSLGRTFWITGALPPPIAVFFALLVPPCSVARAPCLFPTSMHHRGQYKAKSEVWSACGILAGLQEPFAPVPTSMRSSQRHARRCFAASMDPCVLEPACGQH